MTETNIIIVEDVPSLAATYKGYLSKDPWTVSLAASGEEALASITAAAPDVAILDVQLPDITGIEVLRRLRASRIPTEVIVVTSNGSVNLAVEAMREGANDFLVKPFSPERLRVTVRNAIERQRLSQTVTTLHERFVADRFCDFIGQSLAMQSVYQILRSAARSKASVFVTGESGTGKELCASALHKLSGRTQGPFVPINCAAIPRDLLESEIFGHVKGAFTGATADRMGAALLADKGTLFLDEICELELPFQAKLLRFLETGHVARVGETMTRSTDVRIVCATNRDPWKEVQAGRFREDLYFRLHVLPVELPPLREREADVLLLARTFLEEFAHEDGKTFTGFSPEAEEILLAHGWPGNVRELRNVIRHVVVLGEGGQVTPAMLPQNLRAGSNARAVGAPTLNGMGRMPGGFAAASGESGAGDIMPLESQIDRAIDRAIAQFNGSIPKAANALKVSPSTIYRRLQGRVGRA